MKLDTDVAPLFVGEISRDTPRRFLDGYALHARGAGYLGRHSFGDMKRHVFGRRIAVAKYGEAIQVLVLKRREYFCQTSLDINKIQQHARHIQARPRVRHLDTPAVLVQRLPGTFGQAQLMPRRKAAVNADLEHSARLYGV
jgi:hypothetical protein